MAVTVPWLAVGSFASGVGALYLLSRLRRHWRQPGAKWFVATIATMAVWCFTYGAALLVYDRTIRLVLEIVCWVSLSWIGFFFVSFALGYTGRTGVLGSRWFRSTALLPVAASGLALTNPFHSLLWTGFAVDPTFGAAGATYTLRPLGSLVVLVATLLVSFGTLLVFDTVVSYGPLYRREAIAVGLSPLPPGFALLAWAGGIGPSPSVNFATLLFLPHIALDAYAFVRSDMFEFHPATRRAGERAAIDDIATPVAIVDVAGRLVNLNPAAEAMLGVEKRAALTDSLDDLLVGDDLPLGTDRNRLGVENGERRREYKVQWTPLRNERDTRLGYTVVFQDVTDELRRERRLEVLNRFLRHNVRNETVVIQARAELLAGELDGDLGEHAATIDRAIGRLAESGEKARTLSNMGADEAVEPIPLRDRVVDIVDSLEADHVGSVTVEIPGDLTLETRPVLLSVLVRNLVENALEHGDAPVAVTATVSGTDDRIHLTVEDGGPGIPEHELAVLDRGRETDLDHGRGVGLWLVRWTATTLAGDLDFDTSDGTTVTVRLPSDRSAVRSRASAE
ncbi:PAS domain-containing protein [Halomicroarcula limicola]|uniref:histidine kinase n=1 Tax=Haloarcula limicola TaxID=1429915 RepID=A0A8J7YDE6_9EURY|nr:histidine kinase N-terminal 7TM domain-containing protein [Halomicroarcula limicola]MBV0924443.1 PAS domain-containing protein [Halomicroarcula limicola]